MSKHVREWTVKLLRAMDDEMMDPKMVATLCLDYLSEADVEDMCRKNDLSPFLEEMYGQSEEEDE